MHKSIQLFLALQMKFEQQSTYAPFINHVTINLKVFNLYMWQLSDKMYAFPWRWIEGLEPQIYRWNVEIMFSGDVKHKTDGIIYKHYNSGRIPKYKIFLNNAPNFTVPTLFWEKQQNCLFS